LKEKNLEDSIRQQQCQNLLQMNLFNASEPMFLNDSQREIVMETDLIIWGVKEMFSYSQNSAIEGRENLV
jgi:hypothetical protein